MNPEVKKILIEKFMKEEILGNPPLSTEKLRALDGALTTLLRESDQAMRDELRDFLRRWQARAMFADEEMRRFLKRWEIRTLFVSALREVKDAEENEKSNNQNG